MPGPSSALVLPWGPEWIRTLPPYRLESELASL